MPLERLFSKAGEYPLGNSTNRVDYQSIDSVARRLYIAKMGSGQLLVFDLEANKLVASLGGFPKVTGVLVVPELHRVYASVPGAGLIPSISVALGMAGLSSGHGAIAAVDTNTLREIARLPGGVFPDGIAYDPKKRRVFVSDELGSGVTVVDPSRDRVIGRVKPGGQVGNVQYDPLTARIYVPVQSRGALAVIDPVTSKLVARYALPGGKHPHGFAVAPQGGVGFVACDGNDRLLTVDLASGRILSDQPIAHDPDVLAIDPALKWLYVASESGTLSTFDIGVPGAPVSLGDVFVAEEAHSVSVDPVSHRLFFPLADSGGHSSLVVLNAKP